MPRTTLRVTSGKLPLAFCVPDTLETGWTPMPPLNFTRRSLSSARTGNANNPDNRITKLATNKAFFIVLSPFFCSRYLFFCNHPLDPSPRERLLPTYAIRRRAASQATSKIQRARHAILFFQKANKGPELFIPTGWLKKYPNGL